MMGEEKAKPKLPDFAMSEAIDKAHDIIKCRMEESLITGSKPCPGCGAGPKYQHPKLFSSTMMLCHRCGHLYECGHEEKE